MTNLIKNIFDMTLLMKIIVLVSLCAPFIAMVSILSGNISGKSFDYEYGAAKNIRELLVVIIFTVPIFITALMIVIKSQKSRYLFLVSWLLLCSSPFALSEIRSDYKIAIIELSFNFLLGFIISAYLLFNSDVKKYFNT